jgi:D-alanyl-D-alanine carboxypeptidase
MRLKLTLIVLLTAALLPASAQSQLPDTPAAKQFSGWLAAFNSGDREVMLKFLQGNYPQRVAQTDQMMRFQGQAGGFDLKKVEESTPTRLTGIVKEHNSDNFARFEINVDPAEPHRITLPNFRRLEEMPPPRTTESEALAALRAKLAKESAADRFAGAVLVAHHGKPVFQEAYGLADREKKVPNSLSTRFRIGSMNKMFRIAEFVANRLPEK